MEKIKVKTHVKTLAGIIWDSGAASIRDCHVLVELGITKPNSKNHSGGKREEKKRNSIAFMSSTLQKNIVKSTVD